MATYVRALWFLFHQCTFIRSFHRIYRFIIWIACQSNESNEKNETSQMRSFRSIDETLHSLWFRNCFCSASLHQLSLNGRVYLLVYDQIAQHFQLDLNIFCNMQISFKSSRNCYHTQEHSIRRQTSFRWATFKHGNTHKNIAEKIELSMRLVTVA